MTAPATPRTPEQIRAELEAERAQLAGAVERLRGELGNATKLRGRLPAVTAGAAAAGFVLAGGVGATLRLVLRARRSSG